MAYPFTNTGYNMYDMISMLQKGIRRYDFERAGFAAYQVRNSYRKVMWNRLLVISAEDCFGIITKENKRPTDIEAEFIEEVTARYRALSDAAEADVQ